MFPPVRKTLPMGNGALSYLDWEGEGPRLVFAHATGFNAQTYQSLIAPLSEHLHVTALDQRGHGFTTLPTPRGFARNWTVFRDDLIAFLDALGGQPAILAGHSMGGAVSMMTAVARPDLVRGLVMTEPVFVPRWMDWPLRLTRAIRMGKPVVPIAQRAARRRAHFDSAEALEVLYRGRGAFKSWPDEMVHDYVTGGTLVNDDGTVRLACSPRIEAEIFDHPRFGVHRLADRLRCPATLLHGLRHGTTCHTSQAADFQRRKPDARVVAVHDAGHFLPMERRELVREEILRIAAKI